MKVSPAGTAPRRLFVTGASGFVGRGVLGALQAAGYGVRALLLPHEAGLPGIDAVRGDITRRDSLRGTMDGCDGVLHLAGAVGYGQTWQACRRINVDGTRNVAEEAVAAGARRFVHFSSVSVYGRRAGVPLDEDAPLQRIGDPYGDTKIESEALLQGYAASGRLALTLLRPTVIYGPGDDKFLPKLVENLKSGAARIIGRGDNRVDLIHIDDVAGAVLAVLARPESIGRAYNLNNPDNGSWRELLEFVAAQLDLPPARRHIPYPLALALAGILEAAARASGKPPRLTRYAVRVVGREYDYRVERIARELGFRPQVTLHRGLAACLAREG
jgi:nucleoside-diphosphate-sugar epimerase